MLSALKLPRERCGGETLNLRRFEQAMGSQAVRSFLGGRSAGDKCLYVSSGGFAQDARYEAERASVPLTLLSLSDLRDLLIDYYERLDTETRALVPLVRTYVPAG